MNIKTLVITSNNYQQQQCYYYYNIVTIIIMGYKKQGCGVLTTQSAQEN